MAKKNNGKDFLFFDDCGFINGDDEGGESYRYSDGSGYYRGADGSEGYIYSDESGYYHGADGSDGYIYSDGSAYFRGADGTDAYKYSDGSGYYLCTLTLPICQQLYSAASERPSLSN